MRNFGIDLQQLEETLVRAVIFQLSISVIVLILLFWATYWVIKAGVRDGIREAKPWHKGSSNTMPATPPGYRWTLVKEIAHTEDMRAD